MERIVLKDLLPEVFIGIEETSRIRESQVWEVPSFIFHKGCRLCIHSESGGGKSSLLSFIYGNRDDYKGKILFDNKNIRGFSVKDWCKIRQHEIALLPQDMRLFPELTALENILLKNQLTNHKTKKEILSLMEELEIAEKKDALVARLSIGQQQRVAFIRSICQPFDFIFLDEPVSHLDSTNNHLLAQIVNREAQKMNAGIISTSVGNHLLLKDSTMIKL